MMDAPTHTITHLRTSLITISAVQGLVNVHLFVFSLVPGSPPYGLSYESVSPSEVNVTWQPPLVPNGVITHYSIEIWNSSHHLNLTSETTNIHITHLRKYAHYRVMVQAHTRVGPGNYSSEPLNITTLEDGERDGVGEIGKKGGGWGLFSVPAGCAIISRLAEKLEGHLIKSDFPFLFSSSITSLCFSLW